MRGPTSDFLFSVFHDVMVKRLPPYLIAGCDASNSIGIGFLASRDNIPG